MANSAVMRSWQLVPARDHTLKELSSGHINGREDLYASTIFGASQDLCCECGKLRGIENIGKRCPFCRTRVEADVRLARRTYLGHMMLACRYTNPITNTKIGILPIAPIHFRLDDSNCPNWLGQKYESIFEINSEVSKQLPSRDSNVGILSYITSSSPELDSAITELIMDKRYGLTCLLSKIIIGTDPALQSIALSCGLTLQLQITV